MCSIRQGAYIETILYHLWLAVTCSDHTSHHKYATPVASRNVPRILSSLNIESQLTTVTQGRAAPSVGKPRLTVLPSSTSQCPVSPWFLIFAPSLSSSPLPVFSRFPTSSTNQTGISAFGFFLIAIRGPWIAMILSRRVSYSLYSTLYHPRCYSRAKIAELSSCTAGIFNADPIKS